MKAIELKDFSCYYKQKKIIITALSHVDLAIETGEFVVVVGASGSGKSTLVKACLGLADYFDGDLFIDGATIEQLKLKTGKFAYVRQEIGLLPSQTVYENIAFPLRVMKTPQAEVDTRVKDIARLVGMLPFLTRKPRQLSGGQQQRVAIGRALVKNPSFVFFDEPFANIDPALRADLRHLVKTAHALYRPTVVFVTHDLAEAFALADRIVVLEQGVVVEQGTPEELKQNATSDLIKDYLNAKTLAW